MEQLTLNKIKAFLTELGQRYPTPDTLFLLGGSALCLLGSPRPTLDLDYVGNDLQPNDLQQILHQVANDLHVEVEAVPIAQFVPLPVGVDSRKLWVGQFGYLTVYIFDPYTIALSKIDRGFDSDIEDVIFLIRQQFITFKQLEIVTLTALEQAHAFDLSPIAMRAHLQAVRQQM